MSYLDRGHPCTIDFDVASGVTLVIKEEEVTPPGLSCGENDITTQKNSSWRTKWPRALKEATPMSFTCAYDPQVYEQLVDSSNGPIGQNGLVTITFPDTSTVEFYGFMSEFTPSGMTDEGGRPTASCTVIPTLVNSDGVETAPNWTAAA